MKQTRMSGKNPEIKEIYSTVQDDMDKMEAKDMQGRFKLDKNNSGVRDG